jgi:hypothetical protein
VEKVLVVAYGCDSMMAWWCWWFVVMNEIGSDG